MKKLFCITAVLALAACNDTASEAPVAEDTAVVEAPAEATPMGLDGKPSYGMFKVTNADGSVVDVDVKEDGTFTYTTPDGKAVNGTWTESEPGNYCETIDGTETCYKEEMKDGEWISTGPDGAVSKIERVET